MKTICAHLGTQRVVIRVTDVTSGPFTNLQKQTRIDSEKKRMWLCNYLGRFY